MLWVSPDLIISQATQPSRCSMGRSWCIDLSIISVGV